jgi:hypothetical protein
MCAAATTTRALFHETLGNLGFLLSFLYFVARSGGQLCLANVAFFPLLDPASRVRKKEKRTFFSLFLVQSYCMVYPKGKFLSSLSAMLAFLSLSFRLQVERKLLYLFMA